MKIKGSDLENALIEKLFNRYREKLTDTEWKVRMDPSKKGILFGVKKEDNLLVYEIFLMRGQFLVLMRKPKENLLGRIQNNFRGNHLARELFQLIWEDSRREKQSFFNHEEYPYENGPLDNRRFRRGGWMDNCVLFNAQSQIKGKHHSEQTKLKISVSKKKQGIK